MKKINRLLAWMVVGVLLGLGACTKTHMGATISARPIVEQPFASPLFLPAVMDGTQAAFGAKSGTAHLGSDVRVQTLGYADMPLLGPTIRLQQGETFHLDFKNNLTEPTNIHWHGLEVPAAQDGYPTDMTPSAGVFNYQFPIKNRAGTYWYHAHADMTTASQVYRGLAGLFIVDSEAEAALGLPTGPLDVPLVVQDKRLEQGLVYAPTDDDRSVGLFGTSVLVNGTLGPVLEVATRTYRFRLLNGSNARIYNFALSTGATMQLIGTDGGLLDAPVPVSSVLLAPGERADILVNFGAHTVGDLVFLQSNSFSGSSTQGNQVFRILQFKVSKQEKDAFVLPTVLSTVEKMAAASAVRTRTFNIGHMMGQGSMMHSATVAHAIDGKTFDANRIDVSVQAGTTEIWEFDNRMGMETHPIHLHAGQFQVLSRTGGRGQLQAWEKGWKDTVLAFPGEKVRIIVRFPTTLGKYLFHCHNLEHEDAGMMLNYEIR